MKIGIQISIIVLLLLPGCYQVANGQQWSDNLFEAVETPENLSAAQNKALTALRNRPEVLRARVIRLLYTLAQRAKPSEKITLNLFVGFDLELAFTRLERRAEQDYTWYGGHPSTGTYATIVVQRDNIVGTVRSGGKLFQIRPIGDGLHTISEVDVSILIDEPPDGE